MARNLLLVFRTLKKNKVYAAINLFGLTLGMTCCLLILSFVTTELSYDRYHEKSDQIFRLTSNLTLGDVENFIATTNVPPALSMKKEFPGIIDATRLLPLGKIPVKNFIGKEFFEERIYYAEPSLFDIFTFPVVVGDVESALNTSKGLVITQSTASKYFREIDPIGEVLRLNGSENYTVMAVVEDVPHNSHFKFDILLSFQRLYELRGKANIESWSSPFTYFSYVLLGEGQEPEKLEMQFPEFVDRNIGDSFKRFGASVDYFLQPITDIHLRSNLRHEIMVHGDEKYVFIFGSVAIFVLLVACLNFMNLATARSTNRVREIGIRKILGAQRGKLIANFIIESIIYSVFAVILAFVLAEALLPMFSRISERQLSFGFEHMPWLFPGSIGLAVVVGVLSGLYPAFFLSSFTPTRVMGHNHKPISKSAGFRKLLVTIQFVLSISFIISTTIVFNQLNFLKNKDLGFDKKNVIVIPLVHNDIRALLEPIKERFLQNPAILAVGASSHVPSQRSSGGTYMPEGYSSGETVMLDGISVDPDYFLTMGMKVINGRSFSEDYPSDKTNSILINEAAAREIGWENPLNKEIKRPGEAEGRKVIGVVKDFFFKSPHKAIRGVYISQNLRPYRALFVKTRSAEISSVVKFLVNEWKELDPARPLDYYFLDQAYDEQYKAEEKMNTIFIYFTSLMIAIACLGLYGMASFTTEQRAKEIGIRKVLGASLISILSLFYMSIAKTVVLAMIVAVPLAYYAIDRWLQDFEFRISIGLSPFIIAGALTLTISIATVTIQSFDLAQANPIKSIQEE